MSRESERASLRVSRVGEREKERERGGGEGGEIDQYNLFIEIRKTRVTARKREREEKDGGRGERGRERGERLCGGVRPRISLWCEDQFQA